MPSFGDIKWIFYIILLFLAFYLFGDSILANPMMWLIVIGAFILWKMFKK